MIKKFTRVKYNNFSVYIAPEIPFWVIPTQTADQFFQDEKSGVNKITTIQMENVAHAMEIDRPVGYQGRAHKSLKQLSELWIHLTDNCNLSCRHCMFSCRPNDQSQTLKIDKIRKWISESYELGCRVIVFTGGEPFVYPDFIELVKWCLEKEGLSIAVLTNGLLLPGRLKELDSIDKKRLHFQISLDGLEKEHDLIRGAGSYKRTVAGLHMAKEQGYSTSVVMAVNQENVDDMPGMIEEVNNEAIKTVHFMWHFIRGEGKQMPLININKLITSFKAAVKKAKELDIVVDNMEAIKSQLFSPIGTRYDLTNAGWESLAIGPDNCIYPTPALIGIEAFNCGEIKESVGSIWKNSKQLKQVREASLLAIDEIQDNPWRYVLGGGDFDHAVYNSAENKMLGLDPYFPLYEAMIEMLLEDEIFDLPKNNAVGLILRMGDVSTDCPSGEDVNFTHCNCLLSLGEGDHRNLIRSFYASRAIEADKTILNPVHYDEAEIDFVPEEGRVRQYGCGSPVADANLRPGESLLDLGSGTGVEVFIAAKQLGKHGHAMGLDMTDAMLDIANRSKKKVVENLGYDNVAFIKGYLESMPVEDNSVDVVISNCVINLTNNKRRVFKEILRLLKPGGRLVISDVITETEPDLKIRVDQKMKGECLGGAYVQDYLFTVLSDIGFKQARIINRFPYRDVQNHRFYSMTYTAYKPAQNEKRIEVLFGGPGKALVLDNNEVINIGQSKTLSLNNINPEQMAEKGLFIIDSQTGALTNIKGDSDCCCSLPAEKAIVKETQPACSCDEVMSNITSSTCDSEKHVSNCLICGAPLKYLQTIEEIKCEECHTTKEADVICENGHYVCDSCHSKKPIEQISNYCLTTKETDLMVLYRKFKANYKIPIHGPEYHVLVPGLIMAAYRNVGGKLSVQDFKTGIDRAKKVPGGSCGFMGICGAAVGAGIAFGVIMKSNPLSPVPRQSIQQLVAKLGLKLSAIQAARCCQREVVTVMKMIAKLSEEYIGIRLTADAGFACEQYIINNECIGASCPVFVKKTEEKAKDFVI